MAAGQSAHDVARRQRERAARLERSAELWEKGAAGEIAVARALEALPAGWVVLHDLVWPGRQRANIDHVAMGPGGVFVIDAKNWSGRIEVRDQVLLQNGRRREPTVMSAAEAARAVQGIAPSPATCTAVLCFVRDDQLHGRARDVVVCTTSNLVTMLTSRPVVLDPEAVQRCADAVRTQMTFRQQEGTGRRGSTRASRTSTRRESTPWMKVVAALAFLVLVASGSLGRTIEWGAEQIAERITDAPPAEPAPVKKARQGNDGGERDQKTRKPADRHG